MSIYDDLLPNYGGNTGEEKDKKNYGIYSDLVVPQKPSQKAAEEQKKKPLVNRAIDFLFNKKEGLPSKIKEKVTGVPVSELDVEEYKGFVPTIVDKYKEYKNNQLFKLMESDTIKLNEEKKKPAPSPEKIKKYEDNIWELNDVINSPSLAKKYVKNFDTTGTGFMNFLSGISTMVSGMADKFYEASERDAETYKTLSNAKGTPKWLADVYKNQSENRTGKATGSVKVSEEVKQWAKEVSPANPDFMDALTNGTGSMAGFMALALITKGGGTVMGVTEAMQESGNVYYENRKNGMDVGTASIEADKDFLANLVVNHFTNKFGLFSEQQKGLKKSIMSASGEGMQEALQQISANATTGQPVMNGVLESLGVGAILGGGFAFTTPTGQTYEITGVQNAEKVNLTEDVKKETTETIAPKEVVTTLKQTDMEMDEAKRKSLAKEVVTLSKIPQAERTAEQQARLVEANKLITQGQPSDISNLKNLLIKPSLTATEQAQVDFLSKRYADQPAYKAMLAEVEQAKNAVSTIVKEKPTQETLPKLGVQTLYHGTTKENVGNILREGLKPSRDMVDYGEAVYLGGAEKAVDYGDGTVLSDVDTSKFKVFETQQDFIEASAKYKTKTAFINYLRKNFGGAYIRAKDIYAVYDTKLIKKLRSGEAIMGKKGVEVVKTEQKKKVEKISTIKEEKIPPKPLLPKTKMPVGTGEVTPSRFAERLQEQLLDSDPARYELEEGTGKYNVLNLEKDAKKAVDFLQKNPQEAVAVGLGLMDAPAGQTTNAIAIATGLKAKAEGNFKLYAEIMNATSLRSTRLGQEIVTLRGQFNQDSAENFVKQVIDARMQKLGSKLVSVVESLSKKTSYKEAVNKKIDSEVKNVKSKLSAEQSKVKLAQDIIDALRC